LNEGNQFSLNGQLKAVSKSRITPTKYSKTLGPGNLIYQARYTKNAIVESQEQNLPDSVV